MNKRHLGDALDMLKGHVIMIVKTILNNLQIIPMFTDKWDNSHLALYARILSIDLAQFQQQTVIMPSTHNERELYFSGSYEYNNDLFLDPDVGIGNGDGNKHLKTEELHLLLGNGKNRILIVFQHPSYSDTIQTLQERVITLLPKGVTAFLYWGGKASLVFIGNKGNTRIEQLKTLFEQYFMPVAETRIVELV